MNIGVVGATGLVGQEMRRVLEERAFPVAGFRAYASPRSEGRRIAFAGGEVVCEVLRDGCFDGLDMVFVDVDDPIAAEWAPRRGRRGRGDRQVGRVPDGPRRAAGHLRGQPRRRPHPPEGDHLVPQLHDDGARHRARAAAPRGRDRADGDLDLPGGVGRRSARPRRAREAVDRRRRPGGRPAARRRDPGRHRARRGLEPPDRRQRHPARGFRARGGVHVGGVEARPREPQNPARPRPAGEWDVRPRPGVRRSLDGREPAVHPTAVARRRRGDPG